MKSRFQSLMVACCVTMVGLVICAQAEGPVIDVSVVPALGQSVRMQSVHTAGITAGTGGANVTWNFSSWSDSASVDTTTFIDAATTPYHSLFSNANYSIASGSGSGEYSYFLVNSAGWETFGSASPSDSIIMTNSQRMAAFPMTYQSTLVDDFAGYMTQQGGATFSGMDTVMCDGYGTLNLPHGISYTDVLRVVSKQYYHMTNSTDTLDFLQVAYNFYSPSFTYGSLCAITQFVVPGFGSFTSGASYSAGLAAGIDDPAFNTSGVMLQPQPANDAVTIVSPSTTAISSIQHFDVMGRLVKDCNNMSGSTVVVSTQDIPNGPVSLLIHFGNTTVKKTLMIMH